MWKTLISFFVVVCLSDSTSSSESRNIPTTLDEYSSSSLHSSSLSRPSRSLNIYSVNDTTTIETTEYINGSLPPPVTKEKQKKYRWLVYVSAVPTILIFIFCVAVIAVKNYYDNDETPVEKKEQQPEQPDGLVLLAKSVKSNELKRHQKIKSRQKTNEVIYDSMLAKFKADKNKKKSFVGRKSSQIRIEGMASRSPKSLARKHIIIGKLNQEDLAPDGNSSALGQLVQLSTHTFIGSKLIEEMTDDEWENDDKTKKYYGPAKNSKAHLQNILERSREDLSEARKILPDDVNEALLPEDLEEAFQNFGTWEESLI